MHAIILLVAASAMGVEAGWEPLPDGGVEYIIQIEPELLDKALREQDIESQIPPYLDVRRVRITVGNAKLPRIDPPAGSNPKAGASPPITPLPAVPPQPTDTPPPAGGSNPGGTGAEMKNSGPPSAGLSGTPPSVNSFATPAAAPPATLPANNWPGAAGAADVAPPSARPLANEAGPALGAPSPAALADAVQGRVANALDDPRAPGRGSRLETDQPRWSNDGGQTFDAAGGQTSPVTTAHRPRDRNAATDPNAESPSGGANPGASGGQEGTSPGKQPATEASAVPERPWPLLMGSVFLLLLSVAANVFLGWVAVDSRSRYRDLLAQHDSLALGV